MTTILRPLIPLLLLGPTLALFSGSAHAARPVAAPAAKLRKSPGAAKTRLSTIAAPSCSHGDSRTVR